MQKGILPFVMLFLFLTPHAQNVEDLESFENAIKPGTQLTYQVTNENEKYILVVTLKKTDSEPAFVWQTDTPENKSGSIAIAAGAMAQAAALYNNFKPGDVKLQNETAIFISKKFISDISATSQAGLKLNGNADTVTTMSNTISDFNIMLDGNLLDVPGWSLQGGPDNKYSLDIPESTKFPLIFKLDMGFTMTLTEIKSK
jgi:hypothetical protein